MRQFPYELIGTNSGTNNGTNVGTYHSNLNNYFKSSHRGKITLYLKKIHQYVCPVKFL